jgi:hypothetical protein
MPRAPGPKNPVIPAEILSREQAMFRDRVAGKSVYDIAAEFGVSPDEAQRIISSQCTSITARLKLHAVELELERLDDLTRTYHPKAKAGDSQAAAICLRLQEQRAQLLGLHSPVRFDVVQAKAEAEPHQSGHDKIRAAIERIAREGRSRQSPPSEEPPASGTP